jgi:hypothetical protein
MISIFCFNYLTLKILKGLKKVGRKPPLSQRTPKTLIRLFLIALVLEKGGISPP